MESTQDPRGSKARRPPLLWRESIPGIVCVGFALVVLILGESINGASRELGPRFWPTVLTYLLLLLGVALFINFLRRVSDPQEEGVSSTRVGWLKLLLAFGIIFVYLPSWRFIPFWLSTFAAVALLTTLFGARAWKTILFFSAIVAATIYLLFVVALRIPV